MKKKELNEKYGIVCPKCGNRKFRVHDTRDKGWHRWRVRFCLKCDERIETIEIIKTDKVIKVINAIG